jgi:hypothetical protein
MPMPRRFFLARVEDDIDNNIITVIGSYDRSFKGFLGSFGFHVRASSPDHVVLPLKIHGHNLVKKTSKHHPRRLAYVFVSFGPHWYIDDDVYNICQ